VSDALPLLVGVLLLAAAGPGGPRGVWFLAVFEARGVDGSAAAGAPRS
jgi:hypothetical protein